MNNDNITLAVGDYCCLYSYMEGHVENFYGWYMSYNQTDWTCVSFNEWAYCEVPTVEAGTRYYQYIVDGYGSNIISVHVLEEGACTECGYTNGEHAENCSQYVAPETIEGADGCESVNNVDPIVENNTIEDANESAINTENE